MTFQRVVFTVLAFLFLIRSPAAEEPKRTPPLYPVALPEGFPQGREAFEKAKELILKNYYSPTVTEEALYWAAIRGMLRHISPPMDPEMAKLLRPEDYKQFREMIARPKIKFSELPGRVGLLEVGIISERASEEVRELLDRFRKGGGGSLIVDLRNNPGGVFDETLRLINLFLPEKKVALRMVTREKPRQVYATSGTGHFEFPMAVLVNGQTASSGEMFAAAMKDHRRARIVGSKTYGKSMVEHTYPLPNRYRIRFATGVMYGPLGKAWQSVGLEPDLAVDQDAATYEKTAKREPAGRLRDDKPLRAAYDFLTASSAR